MLCLPVTSTVVQIADVPMPILGIPALNLCHSLSNVTNFHSFSFHPTHLTYKNIKYIYSANFYLPNSVPKFLDTLEETRQNEFKAEFITYQ
jgi:hypothetical protein